MDHPSNSVLLAKIESVQAIVVANQTSAKEEFLKLFEQASKTNGRVTALERAKYMAIGGGIIINLVFVPVLVALLLKFLKAD